MSIRHLLKQHNNLLKNQTENLANRLVRQFHSNLEELLENSTMDPDEKDDFLSLINQAIKNTKLETDDLDTGRDKDLSHPLPDRYQEGTLLSLSLTPLKTLSKQEKPKKDKEKGKPKKNKSKDKKPYSYLIESSESDAENDMDNDRDRDRDMDVENDTDNDRDRDLEHDTDTVDESQNLERVTLKTKDLIIVTLNPDDTVKELPNVSDQSNQSNQSNQSTIIPKYYYHKPSRFIFDVDLEMSAIGQVNNDMLERFKD